MIVVFINNSEKIYITDLVFNVGVNETEVNTILRDLVPTKDYISCWYIDPYSYIPDI